MAARRRHLAISRFPVEVERAVRDKLIAGETYQQISDWLREIGYPVSRSGVGRYAKYFFGLTGDPLAARLEAEADPATFAHWAIIRLRDERLVVGYVTASEVIPGTWYFRVEAVAPDDQGPILYCSPDDVMAFRLLPSEERARAVAALGPELVFGTDKPV